MREPEKHPWIVRGVVLAPAVLERVFEEARAAYARDEESCGLIVGPSIDATCVDEVVPMENRANKLHALDPETYPRTGRMYFDIDPMKFARAVREGEARGRPVKVLYHSHLDAGAYFSPTDAAVMSLGEPPAVEGGPITMGPGPHWPLAFLVVSVRAGALAGHQLFVWDGAARDFVPSPLAVE